MSEKSGLLSARDHQGVCSLALLNAMLGFLRTGFVMNFASFPVTMHATSIAKRQAGTSPYNDQQFPHGCRSSSSFVSQVCSRMLFKVHSYFRVICVCYCSKRGSTGLVSSS